MTSVAQRGTAAGRDRPRDMGWGRLDPARSPGQGGAWAEPDAVLPRGGNGHVTRVEVV